MDAAAGIAGLIKTVLALEHKQLPPSLHYETPNPHIKFNETPFYVNTELTEWHSESSPRRAGVSSFGVGGTNAHVIIEEPPAIKFASASRPYQLLVLSARTSQALEAATDKLSSFLGQKPSSDLADIAYTLSIGRKVFNYRRTCIVRDAESAAKALALDERQSLQTAYQETCDRSVVFMFPGQGSQYINMGKDLYATEDVFRKEVDDCSSQLISLMGRDLRMLLYQAPGTEGQADKELISAAIAQPALFAIEYARGKLCMSWGVKPKAMIGHSVGEYTAACLAGVMSLEDALKLVCLRGRMMQALPRGVMLALELEEKETASLIKGLPVDIAAVNGPRACVVSGEKSVIEDFRKILKDQGIVNRLLRTSHAFHSRTMNEIVETFAEEVKRVNLSRPEIPFVSNVSGKIIEDTEAVDPFYWGRHLRETVKFWDGVKELNRAYLPVFLEVGPGRTLTTLAQERSSDEMKRTTVGSMKHPLDARNDNECLLEALGNLWLEGARINWMNFYDGQNRRRVRVPTYPFERQRFWIDPGSPAGESQKRQIVGKKADLSEWFYLPSWKRTLSLSPADPSVQKLNQLLYLVFDDGGNLADSIAQSLECGGSRVIRVRKGDLYRQVGNDVYLIEPQRKEDYEELIRQVSESGRGRSDRIVVLHFWSITAREEQTAGVDYFRKIQNLGFYSLLFLAQTLVEKDIAERIELNICSDRIFSVEGAETCIPEKAPITAVCKVLPQENPKIFCRCIDLVIPLPSSPEEVWIKAQILSEIFSAGSDMMIAYRGDRRLLQSYEPVCLDQAIRPRRLLRENGVYLITGGLGGVGLILAEYLALTVKAKVVLVGRSPFPEKCDWAEWLTAHDESDPTSKKILKLQNLERQDAEVMVVSADVADKERMKLVISEIYERFNCLNGVLHAAGTTSGPSVFTSFTEIGIFESELQFRPKVYGTYVLKEILRDRDLDFCMLFSSNASVLGGLGLSAYSAANSFMDAFTDSRAKRSGMTWISASWDEWPEETKRYVGFRTSIDQYSMAIEESCEAFRRVATMMSGGHIIVSTGDLHTRMKLWVGRDSMQATSSLTGDDSAVAHSRPALKSEYLAPRNEPEQIIAEICGRLLGIESIGVDDNFFSLGGHSLLAVKVVSRINDRFCVDLPLAKFFASPTVAELAQVVAEIQGQQNIDEAIDLLHEVAQMTDDEVNVNLSRRSQLG